jgi:FtsP/CotA-like multicopper oxidase with cupredoxin domain
MQEHLLFLAYLRRRKNHGRYNDGNDVEPVSEDRLDYGVSETYDVVVTIPAAIIYEFFTPEDRTKSASLYIGGGIKQLIALTKVKVFEGMKMMT